MIGLKFYNQQDYSSLSNIETMGLRLIISCLRHPQAVEVAVLIGGDDGFGDGKFCFRLVLGGEVFDLVAGLGFQEDEFNVVDVQHGMRDGADLDGHMVAGLGDLGNMLFVGAVGGVGGQFRLIGDSCFGDDDLAVDVVEMHAFPLSGTRRSDLTVPFFRDSFESNESNDF